MYICEVNRLIYKIIQYIENIIVKSLNLSRAQIISIILMEFSALISQLECSKSKKHLWINNEGLCSQLPSSSIKRKCNGTKPSKTSHMWWTLKEKLVNKLWIKTNLYLFNNNEFWNYQNFKINSDLILEFALETFKLLWLTKLERTPWTWSWEYYCLENWFFLFNCSVFQSKANIKINWK